MLEEGLCPGGLITECVFFLHLGELDQATYPSPELTLGTFSNSYSRRRRRLRPIKTGVESAFFPPK